MPKKCFLVTYFVMASIIGGSVEALAASSSLIPLVDCAFNGMVAKGSCLVDTGSSITVLPPQLQAWSARLAKGDSRNFISPSGQVSCLTVHIDSLSVGGTEMNHGNFSVCNMAIKYGLIGIDAFDNRQWIFDYYRGKIDEEKVVSMPIEQLPMTRDENREIYLPVSVGKNEILAQFDTGIYDDGAISPGFLKANSRNLKRTGTIKGDSAAGVSTYEVYELDALTVGPYVLTGLHVILIDQPSLWNGMERMGSSMFIGLGAISRLRWRLDLKNDRWAVRSHSD
jgi:hypothetical protein